VEILLTHHRLTSQFPIELPGEVDNGTFLRCPVLVDSVYDIIAELKR
jgi:hypothetical protein